MPPFKRVMFALGMEGIFPSLLRGYHSVALGRGWVLETMNPNGVRPVAPFLRDSPPDVLVIQDVGARTLAGLRRACPQTILVAFEPATNRPQIATVGTAHERIGEMAAEHLIDRGIEFGAIYAMGRPVFARRRAVGFRNALRRAGIRCIGWGPHRRQLIAHDQRETTRGIDQWAEALPRGVGIFACCDSWGRLLLNYLKMNGISVPDHAMVVSVDNVEMLCTMSTPSLSSVHLPWERVGAELARLTAEALAGASPPDRPVCIEPVGVVPRQSSSSIRTDDVELSQVLHLMNQHLHRRLTLAEVLRQIPMDRHRLQSLFRREVGRTFSEQLKRMRLERAQHMLATTDLKLEQVARRSGFTTSIRLCTVFRECLDLTPSDYRQRFRG